jgi:hypothetical protein
MARQQAPDPYQADYDRWKAAGFPQQEAGTPGSAASGTGTETATGTGTGDFVKTAVARPAATVPPGRLIAAGVVVILVIIAALIGHAVASHDSIAVGDCVVTNPSPLTGWDIKKVSCTATPGTGLMTQRVESVQDTSSGDCGLSLTTFQDDPSGKTYCLSYLYDNTP